MSNRKESHPLSLTIKKAHAHRGRHAGSDDIDALIRLEDGERTYAMRKRLGVIVLAAGLAVGSAYALKDPVVEIADIISDRTTQEEGLESSVGTRQQRLDQFNKTSGGRVVMIDDDPVAMLDHAEVASD